MGSSYLHIRYIGSITVQYKFVCEGHQVKIKVTRAQKGRKSLFPQCKISIGMGLSAIAD